MTDWDPYLDLDTGVLRNRLGIAEPAELARAEAELTALRLIELRQQPLPGRYDLAHLQAFHQFIFGDVYDWGRPAPHRLDRQGTPVLPAPTHRVLRRRGVRAPPQRPAPRPRARRLR